MSSLGLNQLIKEVTHPACLDRVYTNRPQHIQMTEVFNGGMSHYLPVCLNCEKNLRNIDPFKSARKPSDTAVGGKISMYM